MLRALNGGAIHVPIHNLDDGIAACRIGGFDCLSMSPSLVTGLSVSEIKDTLFDAFVAPGAWGVPFNWRGTQEEFDHGFETMKEQAATLAAVGVTRCGTWVLPGSNDLTLEQNHEFHFSRLEPIGRLLHDNGMSLGLEFVGPKTLRDSFTHPFYYDLNGMYGFALTLGQNVGLLVDAWHIYTSESSLEDLSKVPAERIALVHINDAPANVALEDQVDNRRCLPCETGVIDMSGFMATLRAIGYKGPIEVEPFDDTLKDLASDKERLEKTGRALRKAFTC